MITSQDPGGEALTTSSLEGVGWLEEAFERTAVGMVVKDAEGSILQSNPAFRKMLGYGEEELRAMLRRDFTHSEDSEKDAELYSELLRGGRNSFQIEKRYSRTTILWHMP